MITRDEAQVQLHNGRWYKRGEDWLVATNRLDAQPGERVIVTANSGRTKQVTLGEAVDRERGLFRVVAEQRQAVEIGGTLESMNRLFETARQHMKRPAIVLRGTDGLPGVRISVAGERAKYPGSLTLTSAERDGEEGRAWYGRINYAGAFEPSRDAPAGLAETLRAFASDPAGVAAEHGRRTQHCCFCNIELTHPDSVAVGYGPICAKHFGLPWGKPKAVAAPTNDGFAFEFMGVRL
jgi:hypothetical protein